MKGSGSSLQRLGSVQLILLLALLTDCLTLCLPLLLPALPPTNLLLQVYLGHVTLEDVVPIPQLIFLFSRVIVRDFPQLLLPLLFGVLFLTDEGYGVVLFLLAGFRFSLSAVLLSNPGLGG